MNFLSGSTVIQVADDFLLHVTVARLRAPAGSYHLKFETQFLRALDPQARRTAYSVTLPSDQLREISGLIEAITRGT